MEEHTKYGKMFMTPFDGRSRNERRVAKKNADKALRKLLRNTRSK